ncbi:hypothetical protein BAE44_0023059 [Dichanthelium oligosanthes]|uniref:GH18 domain-containing protein n=1 Tax=Dichanthelium oligosanthes TaxID=888268 RepID=A0A1E5USN7_9POAL|nr:hypothetical protein BAE44_0023059 [Dichanthelium oligosanthes]
MATGVGCQVKETASVHVRYGQASAAGQHTARGRTISLLRRTSSAPAAGVSDAARVLRQWCHAIPGGVLSITPSSSPPPWRVADVVATCRRSSAGVVPLPRLLGRGPPHPGRGRAGGNGNGNDNVRASRSASAATSFAAPTPRSRSPPSTPERATPWTRYGLDGVDVDYEHFGKRKTPEVFAECVGRLVRALRARSVISLASIAPFVDPDVQAHYGELWRRYGPLEHLYLARLI